MKYNKLNIILKRNGYHGVVNVVAEDQGIRRRDGLRKFVGKKGHEKRTIELTRDLEEGSLCPAVDTNRLLLLMMMTSIRTQSTQSNQRATEIALHIETTLLKGCFY